MKKLNVIIVAHEFSPFQGSECAVGWNLVNEISKYHNVTVIYATTNQFETSNYTEHVNAFFRKNKKSTSLTLISIPQSPQIRWLIKINKFLSLSSVSIGVPILYFICYRYWQKEVYKFIQRGDFAGKIDLIHQLTSISFREPGYLWRLDMPFVWGPISGNVMIPVRFFSLLSWKQIILESVRNFTVFIQLRCSSRVKHALSKASMVYCVTKNDFDYFESRKRKGVRPMLDVGCLNSRVTREKCIMKKTLSFVWIGRIVYSKALEVFIKSIKIVNDSKLGKKVNFLIIGDGPDQKKNILLAEKLNITNLSWLGHMPHHEVLETFKLADCLIHTSIREATSATILESLSFGVPVICHDAFGMSIAINENCGKKIPFISVEESIRGFADAMIQLIKNPEKIDDLSLGAFKRSSELSWASMARTISNDYIEIYG